MSYISCNFQCILPEETILSIGGVHHKIQPIDGRDLRAESRTGPNAGEINSKGMQ